MEKGRRTNFNVFLIKKIMSASSYPLFLLNKKYFRSILFSMETQQFTVTENGTSMEAFFAQLKESFEYEEEKQRGKR